MNIHVMAPFSLERNLGKVYNQSLSLIPQGDWVCLIDHDVMLLTSDAINHLYEYVRLFPDTGIFTCWTNRLHPLAKQQLWNKEVSENRNIENHLGLAQYIQQTRLYQATELTKHISGFLMMIKKEIWDEIKFSEDKKCLGVDNDFSDRVLKSGRKILRMDGIYVWHTYRLINGINDKSHLL